MLRLGPVGKGHELTCALGHASLWLRHVEWHASNRDRLMGHISVRMRFPSFSAALRDSTFVKLSSKADGLS